MRRKTNEQFKHEVYILAGNEYTFLDKYVNGKAKIKVKHNKCRNVYKVAPDNFIRGSRCPYCSIKERRKTDEEFKQEIFNLVKDKYTFLDKYVNADTKIKVKHNKCKHIYIG